MREDIDEFAHEISQQFITHLENIVSANPDITTNEIGYTIHIICRDLLATSIFAYGAGEEFSFAEDCMTSLTTDTLDALRGMGYGRA